MRSRPALWMAGVAFAGVVAGHSLAYFAAEGDSSRRDTLLLQTGHTYWRHALVAALILEVAALGAVAVRHFRAGLAGLAGPGQGALPIGLGARQLALRLALIQVMAFTALEVGERVVSGVPVGGMFANHLFVLGIALQLLVAGAGASLLRWLARAAQAIGSALRPAPPEATAASADLPRGPALPALGFLFESSRGRGPPPYREKPGAFGAQPS